jgi:phosphatidylglycerophosphate synthase
MSTSTRALGPGTKGRRPAYRDVLVALGAAQKPGAGVPAYMRWVNRRLARPLAAAAVAAGLVANAVSVLSALVSATGLALLMACPPSWGLGLGVAGLLALGFALDSADGQVARVTGTGSPAGEWLDHVIDAVRTPAIHLAVLVALLAHHRVESGWLAVPLLYTLVSVGIFMSQILAEQLRRATLATRPPAVVPSPPAPPGAGVRRSLLLLPTDFGLLCWVFALWGDAPLFLGGYALLLFVNGVHFPLSARRRYRELRSLEGVRS